MPSFCMMLLLLSTENACLGFTAAPVGSTSRAVPRAAARLQHSTKTTTIRQQQWVRLAATSADDDDDNNRQTSNGDRQETVADVDIVKTRTSVDGEKHKNDEPLLFQSSTSGSGRDKEDTIDMSCPSVSVFDPEASNAAKTASFGDVVSLRKPSSADTADPLLSDEVIGTSSIPTDGSGTTISEERETADRLRRRNVVVAALSVVLAVSNWLWSYTHPIQPIQLLVEMQSQSAPLSVIGNNGRPTVVDFWAPWCENCKVMAPTMQLIEQEYKDRVNFVMVNGDLSSNFDVVETFGVDAIPHVALVNAKGDVETALIGPIPKRVIRADLDVLLQKKRASGDIELPYKMLDVFEGKPPEMRRVHFDDMKE